MKRTLFLVPALLVGLSTILVAQKVQTLPAGYLTTNGDQANSWPWNNTNPTGHRCMWIYDSSHVNSAGPVLINKLRWRAHANYATWTGGTHPNVTINMSTCPVDHASASITFATNHGKDLKTVFKGTATVTPDTHANGRWYVEMKLAIPFKYDPTQGDLVIDYIRPAAPVGLFVPCDTVSAILAPKASRLQSHNSGSATTGTYSANDYAIITEITWIPATGLYAGFSATPTAGSGPLKVQFTDQSFSSASGGVKGWAWDFNGDSKIDSNLQNPSFIYPSISKTAKYDVSLTVNDGAGPPVTVKKVQFITVDPAPTADFTATPTTGAVKPGQPPMIVTFTDKSIGAKTWAWDLNGDNIVDTTLQNPKYPYIKPGQYTVKLDVTGVGGKASITKTNYITVNGAPSLTTTFASNNGGSTGWGNFFDVNVKAPGGIWITKLDVNADLANSSLALDVYMCAKTYVGNSGNASVWTKVSTGSTTSTALHDTPTPIDVGDIFLPQGSHGIAIYYTGTGMGYTNGTGTNQKYSCTDFDLSLGEARTALFSGSIFTPRVWNGTIHYITNSWAAYGVYGVGCKGSNGIPTLKPGSPWASLGVNYRVDLANMPTAGGAVVVFNGFAKDKLLGLLALPFDLTPMGATGCNFLTDIKFTMGATNVAGKGSFILPIPNDPLLLGAYITSQAAVLDLKANGLGVTFTNGGEMHIGM